MREKVEKYSKTLCFSNVLWLLEGRKSRLAQADEKLHSVMARSTFPSQNAKKNLNFGALLEVEMSRERARLWHEAHVEAKSVNNWRSRSTF